MAKAKAKAKAKGAKKGSSAKSKNTARDRNPGRRPEPAPQVKARHEKKLTARVDRLNKKEQEVQDEKNELAREIDAATADDCSTTWICETVGKSRQTVFKLVAERVDGKQLNPNWGPKAAGAPKPKASTKAKAKATKAATKPKAAKKAAKAKAKPAKVAKPKATKAKKAPAKPNGRKADPAGMSKGKGDARKHPARKPLPKRAMRPRPKG